MMFARLSLASLIIILTACGQAPQQDSSTAAHSSVAAASSIAPAAESAAAYTTPNIAQAASAPTSIIAHSLPANREFVITAELQFRTNDVRKTAIAIEQLAAQQGGFVVSNHTYSDSLSSQSVKQSDGKVLNIERYITHSDIVVRIPRQNAMTFLHALQPHIEVLERQNYTADDVAANQRRQALTAQREQQRAQALQQLEQKTASSTLSERSQTLNQQYTAREREDEAKIQQLELQDKIGYATISLHFRQPEQVFQTLQTDAAAIAAQYRPSLGTSLQQALVYSGEALRTLLLFLVRTWFVWLFILLGTIWWRKQKSRRSSVSPKADKE